MQKREQPTRHGAEVGLGRRLALIVVYETKPTDQVAANITAATRLISKATDRAADAPAAQGCREDPG